MPVLPSYRNLSIDLLCKGVWNSAGGRRIHHRGSIEKTLAQVWVKFCEIFKVTFSNGSLPMATSAQKTKSSTFAIFSVSGINWCEFRWQSDAQTS